MIELKPANSGGYRAYWEGVNIGSICTKDGQYFWWPNEMYWESFALRDIADKLDELNEQVRRELRGPSTGPITGKDYQTSDDKTAPF